MANNVNRTITIGVDTANAKQGIDALAKSGQDLFENSRKSASASTKSLEEQAARVRQLIQLQKDRIQAEVERARVAVDLDTQAKMSALGANATEQDKNKILDEQRQKLEDINKQYKEQSYVVREAQLLAGEEYKDVDQSKGGGGGKWGAAGASMGAAFASGAGAAAIIAGIPMVGGILSAWFSAAKDMEASQNQLRAMTGDTATFGKMAKFGMSTSEFAQMQKQIATTRGVGGEGLEEDVEMQMIAEKAFGLGEGQLTGLTAFERMGGDSPMELMQEFMARAARSELWDIELEDGKIKGFSDLGNLMGDMNSLMEKEAEVSEQFSGERSAALLEKFAGLGGGFEDKRRVSRIQTLDQAIKGGGNEFMEAEIMTALLAENPDQSYHQMRMKRRMGIFGEGNLSAILGRGQDLYGGNQDMIESYLDTFTGGSLPPEALAALAQADPEMFRGLEGDDLKAAISKAGVDVGGLTSRADTATGGLEVFDTAMKDSAGIIGRNIVEAIEEPLKAFSTEMIDFAKDPMQGVVDLWDKAVDKMVETWKNKLTDKDVLKEVFKEQLPMTYAAATVVNKVAVEGTSPHQVENVRHKFTGGGAK